MQDHCKGRGVISLSNPSNTRLITDTASFDTASYLSLLRMLRMFLPNLNDPEFRRIVDTYSGCYRGFVERLCNVFGK